MLLPIAILGLLGLFAAALLFVLGRKK